MSRDRPTQKCQDTHKYREGDRKISQTHSESKKQRDTSTEMDTQILRDSFNLSVRDIHRVRETPTHKHRKRERAAQASTHTHRHRRAEYD